MNIDKKSLKALNSQLAASACKCPSFLFSANFLKLEQEVRDKALQDLRQRLILKKLWVEDEDRDLKIIWEGLFFSKLTAIFQISNCHLVFWHSDKPLYQRDLSEKIAALFSDLSTHGNLHKQRQWFEAFIYVFNLHWDKVDNYRIDKFLMILRN